MPKAACQWSPITGGMSVSPLRSSAAYHTRAEPSSTMAPMTPGNRRLRWRPAEERPPARAARATFFDEDALPIRALRYPAAHGLVEAGPEAERTRSPGPSGRGSGKKHVEARAARRRRRQQREACPQWRALKTP